MFISVYTWKSISPSKSRSLYFLALRSRPQHLSDMNLHYRRNVKRNAPRDEYFFEGLENQMNTFCMSADWSWKLLAVFLENFQYKFMLGFIKTLTNSKNIFWNPVMTCVPAFRQPPMTQKMVPKAAKIYMKCTYRQIFPACNAALRRWTQEK